MKVTVPYFKGMMPRQSSRLLPDGYAEDCTNARLKSGDLTAWKKPFSHSTLTPSNLQTIYKMQTAEVFLRWQDDVNVVRVPTPQDTLETVVFTGARDDPSGSATPAKPKITTYAIATNATTHAGQTTGNYPNNWYSLGVPAPPTSLTATPAGAASGDPSVTNYVYTWINLFGHESAPAPVSGDITFTPGDTVNLTSIDDPSAGEILEYGLATPLYSLTAATKRLYRAATGPSGETNYFFLADVPYGTTIYTDTKTDAQLGEALETEGWILPPTDGHSVVAMPNGITVMASKNQVCFSVQGHPHAYPEEYKLTTDFYIVGLGVIDTTVVILTQANPYIALGTDPTSFSMAKIELPYGCVSKRSIAHLKGFGIIYASSNGLAAINGTGVNLLSDPYFTREQWQALFPATIYGFTHDDRYFFFFDV
jgi:hypothetical protein